MNKAMEALADIPSKQTLESVNWHAAIAACTEPESVSEVPQWAHKLVAAQKAYERAKEKRDAAEFECRQAAMDLHSIDVEKAKWQEKILTLAWGMAKES